MYRLLEKYDIKASPKINVMIDDSKYIEFCHSFVETNHKQHQSATTTTTTPTTPPTTTTTTPPTTTTTTIKASSSSSSSSLSNISLLIDRDVLIGQVICESVRNHLIPSVTTEFWKNAIEKAEQQALVVFANNLNKILMIPPLSHIIPSSATASTFSSSSSSSYSAPAAVVVVSPKKGYPGVICGVDPGHSHGHKIVVMNLHTQELLARLVIYYNKNPEAAIDAFRKLCLEHKVTVVSIGDGVGSLEAQDMAGAVCCQCDYVCVFIMPSFYTFYIVNIMNRSFILFSLVIVLYRYLYYYYYCYHQQKHIIYYSNSLFMLLIYFVITISKGMPYKSCPTPSDTVWCRRPVPVSIPPARWLETNIRILKSLI